MASFGELVIAAAELLPDSETESQLKSDPSAFVCDMDPCSVIATYTEVHV